MTGLFEGAQTNPVPAGSRRAVFLDRDGTLNHNEVVEGKPVGPSRLEDFRILPGVAEALDRFRAAGFLNIVITNQPDLTTGDIPADVIEAMHMRLRDELALDDIVICPHAKDAGCPCRKPEPGLLFTAAETWGIDLERSVMVGDRWRDINAGKAAGCSTVHIDKGYTGEPEVRGADFTVSSIEHAVEWICARQHLPTI